MGEAKRRGVQGQGPRRSRASRGAWLLGGGLLLIVLLLAGGLYWLTSPTLSPTDDLPQAAAGTPPFPAELDRYGVSLGQADAAVVVREFADFQCPACARFAELSPRLKQEYIDSGKVRLVYFDFPLPQHANAVPAARAARCAGDQDAYWPMHALLFQRQSRWSESAEPVPLFAGYARELGLDRGEFERCLSGDRHRAAVEGSLQAARQLRVVSTPTVYVDNVQLTRPGWYQLAGVIERQLKGE